MRLTRWQQEQEPRIESELTRIVDALRRLGAERVILFGSHARGDSHEGSDIDLIVILDTEQRMVDRIERVLEAVDSEFTVEPLVYTPREFELLEKRRSLLIDAVAREGRVLYERGA